MKRDEALEIVNHYVKNRNLVKHMLAVEAAMRFYARKYGEDEEKWGITGLPEEIIRAIQSHANHTGIPRETLMERALFACDEITGLITAVALVRPSHALFDLKLKSVKKKWKDKSFAAGANRAEIEQGAVEFDVDLWEHTANVIQAMNSIAEDLDLAGAPQVNQ